MVLGREKFTSINTRLKLLAVFSLSIFLLTTLIVVMLLTRLHDNVDQLVGNRFEQALANSQNRSDFGLLIARLGIFRTTFYGNENLVATEGRALKTMIEQLTNRVRDSEQRNLLYQLQEEYHVFLRRAFWVNYTFLQRRWQEKELEDLLTFNSENLMQQMIAGAAIEDVLKTLVQLRELRIGFQQISGMFLTIDRTHGQLSMPLDHDAILAQLKPIQAIAREFAAGSFPVNLVGRELLGRIDYMAFLLHQHEREIVLLREQSQRLGVLAGKITVAMQNIDQQTRTAVAAARQDIGTTLARVFAGALAVCLVLVGAVLFSHRWMFRRHVQLPMELVGKRLQAFEQGDHATPMQLARADEWQHIESMFNDMLHSLDESFSSLRESEQRYREIVTNATEGIFRISLNGRFLAINPAAAQMLGHASEEEAIAYYDDLQAQLYVNGEDCQRLLNELYARGRNSNSEVLGRRKDGQLFWMQLNKHLVYSEQGEPLFIEGTVQDVTVRKAAEESLSQLKNFLQRVIDSMPSVLVAVDPAEKIVLWNRRAEQECQVLSAQALGMPLKDALLLVRYDLISSKLAAALTTRKTVRLQKIEGHKVLQGGTRRHYDIMIYPLPAEEDGGAVIHIDDVTEQVALEQILIQKEKMESIAGLAAGFAHELNNPLAVILQSAQVLQRRLSPDFSKNVETATELGTSMTVIAAYLQHKKCDTMINSIAEAGTRAAKIVENIQTFSRRSGSDFTHHSLDDLVERTLDLAVSDYDMRRHLNYQRIRIVRDYQSVPEVICDAAQIQQTLLILLKNAAQALVNRQDDPQIQLRITAIDEYVCLEVRDNGCGMSPDTCRRAFDPFYTTQEVGQGVGLGLSIAYHIVTQNHRGFLSVTSEVGVGSNFELFLPTLKKH